MSTSIWAARLLPASFRGIPFFVESHELKGGRNAVNHEVPDRDKTKAEDIGRKGKLFTVEGHVLGDNYFFIRDGLIKAMETRDRGILIHPYLGAKEVQPEGFTVKESTEEGRIARFSFTFIEAGDATAPFAILDAITNFITTAVVAVAQVQNVAQLAIKVAELPGYAVDSLKSVGKEFVQNVRNSMKNSRLKPEQQADLGKKLDEYEANLDGLAQNPASNVASVDGIISALKDVVAEPLDNFTIDTTLGRDDKLDIFEDLLNFEPDTTADIPLTTPTRIQEKANSDAYKNLVKQLAIIRLSEQAIEKNFESINAAVNLRDLIGQYINEQLSTTNDDTIFQTFKDLYAKLVATLPGDNSSLSSIKEIELLAAQPSLVLTYDLYESPDNERDILDRNRVRNPGFISGEIEVLTE